MGKGYHGGVNSKEAFIALNMIDHVGPVRVRQLLDAFGSAPAILAASRAALLNVAGIGLDTAEAIAAWTRTVDLTGELRRIAEFGCQILSQEDEDYPPLLRQIYDPPIVLYVKGNLTGKDRNAIALVGSRETTHYGTEVARKLAYQLAYLGITVVSGGARGIDTAAHQGALSARGRTIAVLGTGIDLVFPPENRELFERLTAHGAILTQFPFGRQADKQSFPIRNRIVAGMTLGTVVVEANLTSGALITANFATDYGRQVFAVPGRIDSPRSKGCHDLIKKGAKLCESPEDILTEFEYLFPPTNRPPGPNETGTLPALELSGHEQAVYSVLESGQGTGIDEIIQRSGLPTSAVAVALLNLELKRLIRQLPGKIFLLNRK
ncbi:MAG TPA: DNA-processing protein DprA [Verrucomicrobiae bacterium]|nr:DNA-processing protein DprA [Verrucomicrobiae bacterium]